MSAVLEAHQIIRSGKAAERLLAKMFPGHTVVRQADQRAQWEHPLSKRLGPSRLYLDGKLVGEAAEVSEDMPRHRVQMTWLMDGDGHRLWAGFCHPCALIYYWTEVPE